MESSATFCMGTKMKKKMKLFFVGFEIEYFQAIGEGSKDKEKGSLEAFKSVLGSKATEESLVSRYII